MARVVGRLAMVARFSWDDAEDRQRSERWWALERTEWTTTPVAQMPPYDSLCKLTLSIVRLRSNRGNNEGQNDDQNFLLGWDGAIFVGLKFR